jgi:hypothetical protein
LSELIDLTGKTFGRLTVIKQVKREYNPRRETFWLCKCSCTEEKYTVVVASNLKRGTTKSCGCLAKEKIQEVGYKNSKYNKYVEIDNKTIIGELYNSDKIFYFSKDMLDFIKNYCWLINKDGYIVARDKKKNTGAVLFLHKLIFSIICNEEIDQVDHEDRNKLNNVNSNLRKATPGENGYNKSLAINNTSGVIGISLTEDNTWHSYLGFMGKRVLSEIFKNFDDAVRARLYAEKEYFKELAPQKHLFEQYGIE